MNAHINMAGFSGLVVWCEHNGAKLFNTSNVCPRIPLYIYLPFFLAWPNDGKHFAIGLSC